MFWTITIGEVVIALGLGMVAWAMFCIASVADDIRHAVPGWLSEAVRALDRAVDRITVARR